jgi:hypothetical protein
MAQRLSKNGKPLGRPRKNAVFSAVPQQSSGNTFIIDNPQPVFLDPQEGEIECSLVQIPQYSHVTDLSAGLKHGRYSSSDHKLTDFKIKKWVVLTYLKADFSKYRILKMNDREIIQRCLNYLNRPEDRKKYQKKDPTPKFGKLELFSDNIKFTNKFGYECAILELSIDERTNENFWGEGEKR